MARAPTADELLNEWEKDQDVRDRYKMLTFGLERKIAYLRKMAILDTVSELKHRFRKVLSLYLLKKSQKSALAISVITANEGT